MQGSWNNEAPYYRCVFLREYAAKNKIDHPRAVYLREDQLVPHLDRWLASKFSPALLQGTITELAEAQQDPQHDQAAEQAREDIAQCDAKLRQHRAALEAGADPAIVASWMAEVQAQRTLAEARLTKTPKPRLMTREEINAMVTALHHIVSVLNEADPADKTEIYGQLGLRLTYQPGEKIVIAQARPLDAMYVRTCPRGDLNRWPMSSDRPASVGYLSDLHIPAAGLRWRSYPWLGLIAAAASSSSVAARADLDHVSALRCCTTMTTCLPRLSATVYQMVRPSDGRWRR